MDLITRTFLIAGAILNLCAMACLFGIAFIIPLAYPNTKTDEVSVLFVSTLIVASTLLSWYFFRREFQGFALLLMYAWWIVGVWFINRLILGT